KNLSETELTAEGDKSPGVLLASGYIAGGAITGIVIAAKEMVGSLAAIGHRIEEWQTAHNPFLSGRSADLLALIPFFIICLLLYLVCRLLLEKIKLRTPFPARYLSIRTRSCRPSHCFASSLV